MAIDPIKAPCKKDYFPAYRSSGSRPLSAILWIVMHDEEATTAESGARWFQNIASQGSAHLSVDDVECFRSLANSTIPWGAASAPQLQANRRGLHIEQAGYALWSMVLWRKHWRTLKRSAYKAALHCDRFGLPAEWVDASALVAGARSGKLPKGVTTHAEITKASKILNPANALDYTHTDPGRGWPRWLFMRYVRQYLAEIEAQ